MKLLGEFGKMFRMIRTGSVFLNKTLKAQEKKEKVRHMETINKMSKHSRKWEKIFANCTSDKWLISRIHTNPQCIIAKILNQIIGNRPKQAYLKKKIDRWSVNIASGIECIVKLWFIIYKHVILFYRDLCSEMCHQLVSLVCEDLKSSYTN